MRYSQNFRLQPNTIAMLTLLAKKEKRTKTEVLEQALDAYMKAKLKKKQEFLSYAGCMKDMDVEDFLKTIYESRVNKDIRVLL